MRTRGGRKKRAREEEGQERDDWVLAAQLTQMEERNARLAEERDLALARQMAAAEEEQSLRRRYRHGEEGEGEEDDGGDWKPPSRRRNEGRRRGQMRPPSGFGYGLSFLPFQRASFPTSPGMDYEALLALDEGIEKPQLVFLENVSANVAWSPSMDTDSCSICLCDFEEGDTVAVTLKCMHKFHSGELEKWLMQGATTCPICKEDLNLE